MINSLKTTLSRNTTNAGLFGAIVCFFVYSFAFMFRKAFIAAGYEGILFWGVDYKVWLVTSQVLGYMTSKFYGVRFLSETKRQSRGRIILGMFFMAWIALLGFAMVPAPYGLLFFFLNGFPLGMLWGLVFSYAEGRKSTELMGAILASSFIFSSGFAKSAGKWMLDSWGVSEQWMPFATGSICLIPAFFAIRLLDAIPDPTEEDVRMRTERKPMNAIERRAFVVRFAFGLITIIGAYMIITILRDFRDNFARELLKELNLEGSSAIFTQTEIGVTFVLLAVIGSFVLIKDNEKAFAYCHWLSAFGLVMTIVSTWFFIIGYLSGFSWFLITGVGLYMGYIPFNCIYFERMLASFHIMGNVAFVMYLADACGYLGSVTIALVKGFGTLHLTWVSFFANAIFALGGIGCALILTSLLFFKRKLTEEKIF